MAEARRRALPAIVAYRDGGCVLPTGAVERARARDDVVPRVRRRSTTTSCRCSSRTCTSTAPTRARSRGATRSPPTSATTRTSSSSAAASPASSPASAWRRRACRSRSSRRTAAPAARGGRTATRAPGSTSAATSTATRSSRPTTGPSTSRQHPELSGLLRAACSSKHDLEPHCRFGTAVDAAHLRRARPVAGRSTHHEPRRQHRGARRAVRHQRGRCAQHRRGCPTSPAWTTFAGPSFHSARWDRRPRLTGASGSRSSAPAPAASRSRRPSPTRSSSSPCTSAPRSGCSRTRNYHRRVPDGERWAIAAPAVLRTLVPLPHLLSRASGCRHRALPHRSRLRRRRARRSARRTRATRELFAALDARAARRRRRARSAKVDPRLPGRPPSGCCRTTARGSRACGRTNVELVRTGIERIVADGVITVDGTLPPRRRHLLRHRVPPQRLPRGRCTSPAATASSLRDQWGDEPTAYLGITVPELPEPLLPLRPGHEPRARREPDLPVRVPGRLRDERAPRAAHVGHRTLEPRPEVAGRVRRRGTRARSRRWCGRTSR